MLSTHETLRAARRWQTSADLPIHVESSFLEQLALIGCGALAAVLVLCLDFRLRIPGHAIVRAVIPMALGMALVPRRGAGWLMALGAAATWGGVAAGSQQLGLDSKGLGSTTSLLALGPFLDMAVRFARNSRHVYAALAAGGVLANLFALAVQTTAKWNGWDAGGGKPLAAWLPLAAVSYPAWGAFAGLTSAVCWFRWRSPPTP